MFCSDLESWRTYDNPICYTLVKVQTNKQTLNATNEGNYKYINQIKIVHKRELII